MLCASQGENTTTDRRKWTPEEDVILTRIMEKYQFSKDTRWTEVAACIPGRTAKACRKRWVNGLNDRLKKGSWAVEEDERLRSGVAKLGNDWARIAEHVGNRSGDQCSKRWREVLDPMINKSSWTEAEDKLLVELFKKHGSCWQIISTHFDNRRALQCRNRCCKLLGLHAHSRVKKNVVTQQKPTTPTSRVMSPNSMAFSSSPNSRPPAMFNFNPVSQQESPSVDMGCVQQQPMTTPLFSEDNMNPMLDQSLQTMNFLDAWSKVQGFASADRKDPPAALNLAADTPACAMPSPQDSLYSPFLDSATSILSSAETSPTTPALNTNFVLQQNLLANTGLIQPVMQISPMAGDLYTDPTSATFGSEQLTSPSPSFNMVESLKVPLQQQPVISSPQNTTFPMNTFLPNAQSNPSKMMVMPDLNFWSDYSLSLIHI